MKRLMLKIFIPLILLSVIGFFFSPFFRCSDGFAPEFQKITEIKINEISADNISLSVKLQVKNSNSFEVIAKDLLLFLILDNDTLGMTQKKELSPLAPNSLGNIDLLVNLKTHKIARLFNKSIDSVNLRLIGKVTAVLSFISLPVKIDFPYTFSPKENISEILENDTQNQNIITVKNAAIKSLSLSESSVLIDFILRNPYRINFKLISYPSKIFINGKFAGNGDVTSPISVLKNNNETSGEFLFKLNNFNTISSLLGSVLSGKLNYESKGILFLEFMNYKIEFPYNFKGVLIKL